MTVRPVGTYPDQRNCALYRIMVLDPRTNYKTITLGYIGETVRAPFTRFMEHLYEQPWADTIVGKPHVDERTFVGKAAVLAAEKAAVEAELPLYNIEWNMGNPQRIPPWVALEQAAARGHVVVPRQRRSGGGVPAAPDPQPSALARWWDRRRWWVYGLAGLWVTLFAGACWLAAPRLGDADTARVAASGATLPFVLTWAEVMRRRVRAWWRRTTRPKRRRRGRR